MSRTITLCILALLSAALPVFAGDGGSAADGEALVARWTMQAHESGEVYDAGPHGLHAELHGKATLVAAGSGREGYAVRVGDGQACVRTPQSGAIDRVVQAVTFTAWVSWIPTNGAAAIMAKRTGWHEVTPYALYVTEGGGLWFDGNDGQGWFHAHGGDRKLKTGQWHHVAFTYAAKQGLDLYIDGQRVGGHGPRQALQRNNRPLVLGFEKGGAGVTRSPLQGLIGETRLYAAKLTASQVQQDMTGDVAAVATVTSAAAARSGQAVETNGRLEASIVFDRQPLEQGLTFARNHVEPATVEVNGEKVEVWKVKQGSSPDANWVRSLYLTFTDERFREGRMPAVDIEVTYFQPVRSQVIVLADTERGSTRVGSRFKGGDRWHVISKSIDDAFFGAREHEGNPQAVDGYDLRINGVNEDWYIRSIRVVGYDLKDNPDFHRLVEIESIETLGRPIFLFPRGNSSQLIYRLRNIAHVGFDATYRFTLTSRDGRTIVSHHGDVRVEGDQRLELPFTFDTQGLPLGVYDTRFELRRAGDSGGDSGSEPIVLREGTIGVRSDAVLRKAKPGEFLYGLDPQNPSPHTSPALMAWIDQMGVDIVRQAVFPDKPEEAREIIRALQGAGLKLLVMFDVPKNTDRSGFERKLEKWKGVAADLAKEFHPRFWELGNEPDLNFFYPPPMEQYVEGFHELYDAIKTADPEAMVMNGGLAYVNHRPESAPKVRKFIELIDPKRIDLLAYHAHGVGAKAERRALTRIRETLGEYGKAHLPTVDTETGLAADTRQQELMQAATCIQKLVFAQSQKQPFVIWFRLLFEHPLSYSNLLTAQEPRPVVLAYRNVVETLRGYRFTRVVDLGSENLEGYLFEETDGHGRVCVMWSRESGRHTVYLRAASHTRDIHQPELLDMYGNASPARVLGSGTIAAVVTEHPVFVRWQTEAADHEVALAPPVIRVKALDQVVPGRTNPVRVLVRNPTDRALSATLQAQATGEIPLSITPQRLELALEPGAAKTVDLALHAGRFDAEAIWPWAWTVFADLPADPDLTQLTEIPSALQGVAGRRVVPQQNTIDMTALGHRVESRAIAVAMAEVESPTAQTVTLGASADWWMAWYVNGKPVYDTLATGNGTGYRITDHTFQVPLKAGRNLLAVKVLSGEQGWKLVTGSPRELRQAQAGFLPLDRITLELNVGDQVLAHEVVAVDYIPPIRMWDGQRWQEPIEQFANERPTATLGEAELTNLHVQGPDVSRYWGGEGDLSAQAWLGGDEQHCYFVVRVRDDQHRTTDDAAGLPEHDSLQIAIARPDAAEHDVYTIGQVGGSTTVDKRADDPRISARVDRDGGETIYRVAIDRAGAKSLLVNLLINDDDVGYRKQYLQWRPGLDESADPARWHRAVFESSH